MQAVRDAGILLAILLLAATIRVAPVEGQETEEPGDGPAPAADTLRPASVRSPAPAVEFPPDPVPPHVRLHLDPAAIEPDPPCRPTGLGDRARAGSTSATAC